MMINCETCGGTGGRHPFDMGGPATCCDCCGTGRMPQLTPVALGIRSRAEMRRFESGEIEFILYNRHGNWMRTILEPETTASLVQALEADPLHEWQTDPERYNNIQHIAIWPDGNIGMRRYDRQWMMDGNNDEHTPIVTTNADDRRRLARALAARMVSPDPDTAAKRRLDDNLRSVFS